MTLAKFDAPGNLADLDAAGLSKWNDYLGNAIDASIEGNLQNTNDSPRSQFYSPIKTETAPDAQQAVVSWIAFPRKVRIASLSDQQRWSRADASRDVQDEYCEWSVLRSADGKITKVAFTCEGPEYWSVLAEHDPQLVLSLYQQHISPQVQLADLFDHASKYIPRNRWNTDTTNGAIHLVQTNNTLGAEIELAAAATIVRVINGRELTGDQELIECGQYGDQDRNSDPHIGGSVNGLARQKADITLTNPVGLYFDDLVTAGWQSPDGSDPKSFWSLTRGSSGLGVRAVYEVPSTKGYSVSEITINGQRIAYGAQIADFISMKLAATACRFGQSKTKPKAGCVGVASPAPGLTTQQSLSGGPIMRFR